MDNGASSYRRFLDGDNSAFVELVKEYNDGLILYMNSFVNNISTSDELAEDVFVKIGVKRPKFNGKSSFKTFLYAIARNVALDHLRKNKREKTVSLDTCPDISDEEILETRYIKEERKIILHKALKNLKPEYRQVLWLIYFEGLSGKEAAAVMKKSVHSVETLSYRAKLALKDQLIKEGLTNEDI